MVEDMDEIEARRLVEQALECRKLAWSLSDLRSQLALHEIAAAYEASAQEKMDARAPAIAWPERKLRDRREAARRGGQSRPSRW